MKKRIFIGIFFLLMFSSIYANKTSPIPINPVVTNFDSLPVYENLNLFMNSVDFSDSKSYDTLGYTRTGRKTKAPLVCKPSLDSIIKKSITSYLVDKKMNATDMSSARSVLNITILNAQITETSKGLTQTLTSVLKINATLVDPYDSSKQKSFVIESQNAKTTFDTTKSAEQVVRGVIEGVINEIMKSVAP